jgi:hypothetical protein
MSVPIYSNYSHRERAQKRTVERIYGGGGNRTPVRGRTEQNVYERSPCLISPAGRFTDDQPTGQPSCVVTPQAIGFPLASSPNVGAGSRASGRTLVGVARPSFY